MPQNRKKVDLIVCMLAIHLAFYLVVPAITAEVNDLLGVGAVSGEIIDALSYVIRFTVPLCVFYILRTLMIKEPIPRGEKKLPVKYGTYMFFAAFMLIFMLGNVYFAVFPEAGGTRFYDPEAGFAGNLFNLLLRVLVPVFIEEIMFRRLVLSELTVFGNLPAILFSSLLFGLMYYDIAAFPYAFVVGAVVGAVYLKSRSILHTVLIRAMSETMLFLLYAARIGFSERDYIATVIVLFSVSMIAGLFSFIKIASDKGIGLFGDKSVPASTSATDFFTWPLTVYIAAAAAIAWTRAFL